jgi:uncharacterized protein (DUF1499 family)
MRVSIFRMLVAAGLVLVAAGMLLAAVGGLGHRWGWWHFTTGFELLRWGLYASVAGVAASLVVLAGAAWLRRGKLALAALPAIVLGAVVIAVPLEQWRRAAGVPPIHDISTDLEDPPGFVALAPAREAAPNAVDHPGEEVARQQRAAYPDLAPVRLAAGPDAVLAAAEEVAREMRWEVVAVDRAAGRLEAVDRTFWFGFRDDIVIRAREAGDGGTYLDVRSASRVGLGDVGTNARRIRDFLARLQDRHEAAADAAHLVYFAFAFRAEGRCSETTPSICR